MSSPLAAASSAYLRSAAHQPVRWHPWGPEPFEIARRESKPILLDIGAVWCHWCHVMDGESYENPEIAELLNRDWVCIKVDRDERPDVDARYQRAVQSLTGMGGWPLTAFLTPDGDVFYGGTYFPPVNQHGRAGFATVLAELSRVHQDQPDRVARQAGEIRKHLAEHASESVAGEVKLEILAEAASAMARSFDFRYGGFGNQPKFPHPTACDFLLARWFDTREQWVGEMVERTLAGMARGGMYDQIAGGFHRYSVDARWIVPHFEKMSYDNSELLRAYVHAASALAGDAGRKTGDGAVPSTLPDSASTAALCRQAVEGIANWVMSVLSDPAGGYYASQDADVGLHDDGDYFTWTPDEIRAVTDDTEYAVLARYYDVDEAGEMHHNPRKNVLWVKQSVPEIAQALALPDARVAAALASGRDRLLQARSQRQTPFVDTTRYSGWNAMMASAMLEAAAFLERPDLERHALATLDRIFRECADGDGAGGIRHAPGGVAGLLEDQVQVANACLDAAEATGDRAWLDRCGRIAEHVWKDFRTPDSGGGLVDVAIGRTGEGFLDQRMKPVMDAPTPSPNGVAATVLARLAEHTGDPKWRDRQREILEAFVGGAAQMAVHGAALLQAVDWHVNPASHVVVVGRPDDPVTQALRRTARATYRPRKVLTFLAPGTPPAFLPPALRAALDGRSPRAYVCAALQCAAPVESIEDLARTLATFGRSG